MTLPDDVKQQGLSVVAALKPEIQAARDTGESTPRAADTPRPALTAQVTEKLARMEKAGHDAEARIAAMKKDDFTRG